MLLLCVAPPKGLDDDEFEYIQDLESRKEDVARKRHAQHEEDLAQFRTTFRAVLCGCVVLVAKLSGVVCVVVARGGAPKASAQTVLTAQHLQKYPVNDEMKLTSTKQTAAAVVVKAKRETARKHGHDATRLSDKVMGQPLKKKPKVENPSKPVGSIMMKPTAAALGLASYNSDSDSQNDEDAAS